MCRLVGLSAGRQRVEATVWLNAVLAADDELCALRYPGTHELHLLSREIPALRRTSPPPAHTASASAPGRGRAPQPPAPDHTDAHEKESMS
ncbi:hypothetical protein JOD53_001862 [Brevibacterium luteolum]|nr:hypothetical protein [Brevibacterium luteolum]